MLIVACCTDCEIEMLQRKEKIIHVRPSLILKPGDSQAVCKKQLAASGNLHILSTSIFGDLLTVPCL